MMVKKCREPTDAGSGCHDASLQERRLIELPQALR
jgi:hypothetical protein